MLIKPKQSGPVTVHVQQPGSIQLSKTLLTAKIFDRNKEKIFIVAKIFPWTIQVGRDVGYSVFAPRVPVA